MPTLREESMECLANDIEVAVDMTNHNNAEDIYNEYLEGLDEQEFNFWTINNDEDEISQEDFMTLLQICAQTNLYPPGWVEVRTPGGSHGHMDRMLKHYYKHICILEKDWLCHLIQQNLQRLALQRELARLQQEVTVLRENN